MQGSGDQAPEITVSNEDGESVDKDNPFRPDGDLSYAVQPLIAQYLNKNPEKVILDSVSEDENPEANAHEKKKDVAVVNEPCIDAVDSGGGTECVPDGKVVEQSTPSKTSGKKHKSPGKSPKGTKKQDKRARQKDVANNGSGPTAEVAANVESGSVPGKQSPQEPERAKVKTSKQCCTIS